jgi:hypothetical protein
VVGVGKERRSSKWLKSKLKMKMKNENGEGGELGGGRVGWEERWMGKRVMR